MEEVTIPLSVSLGSFVIWGGIRQLFGTLTHYLLTVGKTVLIR